MGIKSSNQHESPRLETKHYAPNSITLYSETHIHTHTYTHTHTHTTKHARTQNVSIKEMESVS